jgi:predicted dehydrogenase
MEPIRLGVIGCGIAAKSLHWPVLTTMPDFFRVVACCSRSEAAAAEYAHMVGGIPHTLDYRELLKRDEIEAVAIALPTHLNGEVTRAAVAAGKHVFLEKPLAADMQEAARLVELEQRSPAVTMCAENFRFVSAYHEARKLIVQGAIGRPCGVVFNDFNYISDDMDFARKDWRVEHRHIGGLLTDGGVHRVAALRVVLGEMRATAAFVGSSFPALGRQDLLCMQLQFEADEALRGVYTLQFSTAGNSLYELVVFGTEGTLKLEAKGVLVDFHLSVFRRGKLEHAIACDDRGLGYLEGFKGEFEDFYRAVREGCPTASSFGQGYRDLKVLGEAYALAGLGA